MKLLFDQNISFRIVRKLASHYPKSEQVRRLGLENATDLEIWEFAKRKGYTIVTFDADFIDIANYRGHPPKIIWLRIGNRTTKAISDILLKRHTLIADFLQSEAYKNIACLQIQ